MIRRLVEKTGFIFVVVFVWKVALMLLTAQPVPANDAFFYDGPVVNFLLHGKYCNPSLIHALPISGGEIFCAYPPLHQFALLGWMSLFGTSALAAMWYHIFLLGIYFIIVLAIFRRLQIPALAANLAGLFLFGITFHDRPDTLAHVMGALAVFGAVCGGRGVWLGVLASILAVATSLQIGGVYSCWFGLLLLTYAWAGRGKIPWLAFAVWIGILVGLVALVKFGFPHIWTGFKEHVKITPSVTPWRAPNVLDSLKAIRTAPTIFVVAGLIVLKCFQKEATLETFRKSPVAVLAASGTLAALGIIGASLVRLSPNTIHVANYIQPLIVGAFLAWEFASPKWTTLGRPLLATFVALSLITGIRAIGMTTWGVLCANDVGYSKALGIVHAETDKLPNGSTVVASAAYLYDLANRTNIVIVHNDWPAPPADFKWEYRAIGEIRPARIVLTQIDYYRRYKLICEQLKSHPDIAEVNITNTAGVTPPDAYPKFMRVVQHVSWAPVIVELKWR